MPINKFYLLLSEFITLYKNIRNLITTYNSLENNTIVFKSVLSSRYSDDAQSNNISNRLFMYVADHLNRRLLDSNCFRLTNDTIYIGTYLDNNRIANPSESVLLSIDKYGIINLYESTLVNYLSGLYINWNTYRNAFSTPYLDNIYLAINSWVYHSDRLVIQESDNSILNNPLFCTHQNKFLELINYVALSYLQTQKSNNNGIIIKILEPQNTNSSIEIVKVGKDDRLLSLSPKSSIKFYDAIKRIFSLFNFYSNNPVHLYIRNTDTIEVVRKLDYLQHTYNLFSDNYNYELPT